MVHLAISRYTVVLNVSCASHVFSITIAMAFKMAHSTVSKTMEACARSLSKIYLLVRNRLLACTNLIALIHPHYNQGVTFEMVLDKIILKVEFSTSCVLSSVTKPSGATAERETRHQT